MVNQVRQLLLDLAEMHDWEPQTLKHLSISELIFWRKAEVEFGRPVTDPEAQHRRYLEHQQRIELERQEKERRRVHQRRNS